MFLKRALILLLALCTLSVGAAALEVECDSTYCFSSGDFSDNALAGVCITELPDSSVGTILLGTRVIRPGDILTAGQLDQLTFHPLRTQQDATATVTYLPIYENKVDHATTMTISIRGKEDKAPVAQDSALETYKNLANSGTLKVHDPEGSPLTFTLTRSPRRGDVIINADGTFTYTPKKNKVGTDSFTYTASDESGNVSRQATVTVTVLKPTDKQTYADTLGDPCRFAAEWMRNTGLFTGEMLGTALCFQPDKVVSRGEFLAMLVESLGIPIDENATYTGFSDDAPTWLKPYLAAALRSGLTAGWPNGSIFGASDPITGAEAALLLHNALDMPTAGAQEENPMQALSAGGIHLPEGSITRGQAAQALYRTHQLAPFSAGIGVFAGK